MRASRWVALTLTIVSAPIDAKKGFSPPPMPIGYDNPGPVPYQPLAQIAAGLHPSLIDPYSVRDFYLCQARVMDARAPAFEGDTWRRAFRIVHFKLNSKNQFGGYTGLQAGIADFEDGKLTNVALLGPPVDDEPARSWREPCERVPDAEIQKLLAG